MGVLRLPGLGLIWLLCLFAGPVPAAVELPREPVLRIETGAHLSPVTRIGSDVDGRWAVTASEDKTARLWDLRSGRQLGVLRPPIGGDSVGALYAVGMSPDGRQIALGGNSAFDDRTHAIYLFDRATATLPPKSTLSGLEAPLTQIAWSQDSQLIAIGLRQSGLRVFRRNLGFVGSDPEFNDAIYGAAFSADGRLAVASLDGYLRVYRFGKNGMERVLRRQMPGIPYALDWSPDGRRLAVGLQDAPRAVVLSADSLEVLETLDAGGAGNLGRVAWAADGGVLYAAGSVARNGRFVLLAFDGARGSGREIGGFGNTVTSLFAHRGGLLASSAEPSWSSFDKSGQPLQGVGPRMADFRDAGAHFRVSAAGDLLAFPMVMGGREGQFFDLAQGELRAGPPPENTRPARVPDYLSQWKNGTAPQVRGRALTLSAGERSRSAAEAPDGSGFVLGADWYLRSFSADGQLRWQSRLPGAAWAVAYSGDGRWVLAALGDGSIRWFRSGDGREQLAFFVHADHERWIAWTPGGYYDTSMGGENLIGWHVNRAFNQSADFFSVGRFRDRFYQPSVIQKVVQLGDEAAAVKAFNAELAMLAKMNAEAGAPPAQAVPAAPRPAETPQPTVAALPPPAAASGRAEAAPITRALPPVIELLSDLTVESGEASVPLRYRIRTPEDAPVTDVKVRVNGKLERDVKVRSTRSADGLTYEAQVPVPPKDSEVLLLAENRHAKSDPLSVQVRRPVASAGTPKYLEKYDTLYMLVIAVNKYPGENALALPVKDASDFRRQMQRIANPAPGVAKLYERPAVRILLDEEASQENIRAGLKWLKDSVKARDAAVVFLAGHGTSLDQSYYFIPYRPGDVGRKEHWVSGSDIVGTLQNLPGRAMFFLDTCHSGALANQARLAATVNQVEDERGVIVFASATAKELAQETEEWGNGAFTKALIEGLQGGAADPRDRFVYPTTLKRYVTHRVRDLTENQQRPYVSDHGIDDPIAPAMK